MNLLAESSMARSTRFDVINFNRVLALYSQKLSTNEYSVLSRVSLAASRGDWINDHELLICRDIVRRFDEGDPNARPQHVRPSN